MATHTSGPYKQATPNCDVCGKTHFRSIYRFTAKGGPSAPTNLSRDLTKIFGQPIQIEYICNFCDDELWECLALMPDEEEITWDLG